LEPSKFFIGVIDLFAVILPGAIVTFVIKTILVAVGTIRGSPAVSISMYALHGDAGWVAFAVASYLLGHLIFSASSHLDSLYDEIRARETPTDLATVVFRICTKQQEAVESALKAIARPEPSDRHAPLARRWVRAVRPLLTWGSGEGKGRAKEEANEKPAALWSGTYKTALAILQLGHPGGVGEILRLQADSKFFRSAVVLFLVVLTTLVGLIAHALWVCAVDADGPSAAKLISDIVSAVLSIGLMRLCFARYCEQRTKAVELAYQLLVTHVAMGRDAAASTDPADDGQPAS
jgi:hypothetical protein